MDSDIEIPIWFNGKIKWISNLTRRSTCEDVIKAILSSDGKAFSTNEILYESWRGVERPLKNRCRLLKLWKSWSGEASNVTLTLRNDQSSIDDRTCLLIEQEKKLKKLKKKFEKQNFLFEKYSNENQFIHDEYQQTIQCYLHLYRSILQLEKQIRSEEKSISTLIEQIQEENQRNSHSENLFEILSDVHQTLIISRKLTEQSEQLDEQIQQINDDIDRKQSLLDELELDDALEQNIDLDSLDDENENEEEISHRNSMKNTEHRSEWEYQSPSLPPKIKTIHSRPTAIVEPNFSQKLSEKSVESSLKSSRVDSMRYRNHSSCTWSISTNEESDTGISSFNSIDDQLVTLV